MPGENAFPHPVDPFEHEAIEGNLLSKPVIVQHGPDDGLGGAFPVHHFFELRRETLRRQGFVQEASVQAAARGEGAAARGGFQVEIEIPVREFR